MLAILSGALTAANVTLTDFSRVMHRWGIDDGLRGGRVNAVVQTPDGHLWIGTEHGLFRFNGRQFEQLASEDLTGFWSPGIASLLLDRDRKLWILGQEGEFAVLSDGAFIPVENPAAGRKLDRLPDPRHPPPFNSSPPPSTAPPNTPPPEAISWEGSRPAPRKQSPGESTSQSSRLTRMALF